ncbi:MAG: type II toxin-antitoxin system RelE/ParE family toxin [Balneolaceae bacterium]|nr:type II toxin-antitoxin system RelE/ParE family toxin [Balneolaceae bacterium]
MNTGFNVVWTEEAARNVDSVIDYLQENWSQREVQRFLGKLRERVWLISQNPELFPESKVVQNTRRSVLSKQITIYYRVESLQIEILHVFDTRQNPHKLK